MKNKILSKLFPPHLALRNAIIVFVALFVVVATGSILFGERLTVIIVYWFTLYFFILLAQIVVQLVRGVKSKISQKKDAQVSSTSRANESLTISSTPTSTNGQLRRFINRSTSGEKLQILFVAVIIAVIIYFSLFADTEREVTPCRDTTRQEQVLTKLDGDVTSYETRTIYGCETSDGQFFARPED